MEHLFYKDLWDVRNQITARANEALEKSRMESRPSDDVPTKAKRL